MWNELFFELGVDKKQSNFFEQKMGFNYEIVEQAENLHAIRNLGAMSINKAFPNNLLILVRNIGTIQVKIIQVKM